MDENDVIIIDDERNAYPGKMTAGGVNAPARMPGARRPSVIIHGGTGRPSWTPVVATTPAPAVATPVYASPAPYVAPQPYLPPQPFPQYAQFAPMPFPPYGYPYPPQAGPLSRLGDISPATIVDMAARLLAALSPLPEPPIASGKEALDIENAVVYQTALAEHAKRDEQLRELGHAIAVLLRGDLRKDAR